MSFLPEELWQRILEIGIESRGLSCQDLCCVSISCRRLHRLSSEDLLWNRLLSADYPQTHPSSSTSSKSLYKLRFERDNEWRIAARRRAVLRKERRIAAHRRAVLRKESQIVEHSRKLREIQTLVAQETATATQTAQDLSNLLRARQAFVPLNVWQPEVVRIMQNQMVEQSAVAAECRIHALEMELNLCKQQIEGLELFYKDEKRRLDTAKEELTSMKYHPMEQHKTISQRDSKHVKRKKMKIGNSCESLIC
ncbi:hypothetical protein LR48_Vigan03g201500 [Vigna angularis]|uniref:F-box domain-containing protein n=4 Tax=Phaseolus angularis TaxID=3914 RepID=A0A0L9U754_PHAAN|nr:hypothetical protein LR48_Vigan03g201500 [Vigna angularis]